MPLQPESVSETVKAPAEHVWRLISDVTRMGEWSPQCYRAEWIEGASGPAAGAKFRGYNKQGPAKWSRECVVTEAEPGKVFAFSTYHKGGEQTRWRYVFEEQDGQTVVTESFDVVSVPGYVKLLSALRGKKGEALRADNLRETLRRLREAAERTS